ncbi:hypothetical protein V8C44DRAFT_335188 [Trichoderma aethiopicum]
MSTTGPRIRASGGTSRRICWFRVCVCVCCGSWLADALCPLIWTDHVRACVPMIAGIGCGVDSRLAYVVDVVDTDCRFDGMVSETPALSS